MVFLSSIREFFKEILKEPVDAKTGYEAFSDEELLGYGARVHMFRHSYSKVVSTTPWNDMMFRDFRNDPSARRFFALLMRRLRGRSILEIGAGEQVRRHSAIALNHFGASSYKGVDRRDVTASLGGVQEDILRYLNALSSESTNVMAFGVLNEPLDPTTRLEHEYVRRLARELWRVVPNGGVLFGDGLHSLGTKEDVEIYLLRAGFQHDIALEEELEIALAATRSKGYVRDPFILTKVDRSSLPSAQHSPHSSEEGAPAELH